eukprot:gene21424-biopygen10175
MGLGPHPVARARRG